jgi:hypothetical protein
MQQSTCSSTRTHDPDFLLLLLNAACLEEKQQILILVFDLTRPGFKSTIYYTGDKHINHHTIEAVGQDRYKKQI